MFRRSCTALFLTAATFSVLVPKVSWGDQTEGPKILKVLVHENSADRLLADFGMSELTQLPVTTIRTNTVWTDGKQEFSGVALVDFLALLEIGSGTLEAVAVNDYLAEIPVSDAVVGGPVIAYLHNGEPMSVREKGPLWVVYPYDSNTAYQREEIYARSIWQLTHIIVHP